MLSYHKITSCCNKKGRKATWQPLLLAVVKLSWNLGWELMWGAPFHDFIHSHPSKQYQHMSKKKSSKLKKTNKNKNAVCCYYIQSTSWTSFNKHVFPDGCQTVLYPTEQILKKTLFVSFTGKKVASQLQGRMLKRRQKLVSLLLNWTEINQGEKQGGNCVRKRKRKKKARNES